MSALTRIVRDTDGPDSRVVFDATLHESHDGDVEITDHPVESGANVADHIRAKMTTLSLEVAVSNKSLDEDPWDADGATGKVAGKVVEYESRLNLPISLPGVGSLAAAVGADSYKSQETVNVLTFSAPFDRISHVAALLEQIRVTCEVVAVLTRIRIYTDMVLSRVSVLREAGSAGRATFRLEFKKLRYAATKTAAAIPGAKKAKGRAPASPTIPADDTSASGNVSAATKLEDAGRKIVEDYFK